MRVALYELETHHRATERHLPWCLKVLSVCQKLPKFVEIWRSYSENNFAQFFWDTVYKARFPSKHNACNEFTQFTQAPANRNRSVLYQLSSWTQVL